MNRNLDGVYFRVRRDDKWEDICWTDLTDEERDDISKDRDEKFWKRMTFYLTDVIIDLGEQFDIRYE